MSPRARGGWRALLVSVALALAALWRLPATPLAVPDTHLTLEAPRWLAALSLLPLLAWLAQDDALPRSRRVLALLLRALALAALALALCRPLQRVPSDRTSTVFVVDVSRSIDDEALSWAHDYLERALARRADHHVALITFAGRARTHALPAGAPVPPLSRIEDGEGSDVEGALARALALLAPESAPQVVLLGDGRETTGSLLRAAHTYAALGVPLRVRRDAPAAPEVAVRDLTVPPHARVGEPLALHASLVASAPTRVRLRLLRDGTPVHIDIPDEHELAAGETELRVRARADRAGPVTFRFELSPLGPDRLPENDALARTIEVRGPPRVLYVERDLAHAHPFADLLRLAGFTVDVRDPAGAPSSVRALSAYDFVVLSDLPREALGRGTEAALEPYLREGGGLLVTGGARALGLGGHVGTPLARLLPVALDTPVAQSEPALALMLVIDKSGSMAGDKLERAKEAAIATAELLAPSDYLGVIGFDAEPTRVVRLAVASQRTRIAHEVGRLAPGGGTALFPALDAAYADLAGVRARVRHVVVLTDGQTQEETLATLARSMRADGITLSSIGLGDDVNRALLTQLATEAGGRAYFTRDPARVPRLFTDEAKLVTRSLAVEERVLATQVAPAAFLKGIAIASAPPLGGYVVTRARPSPAQVVLESDRGDPLLARMRVGLGWSIVFTSDVTSRWSAPWYGWRPVAALFAQLVREHMRQDPAAQRPIETHWQGDTLVAAIEVRDDDERYVAGLTGTLSVEATDGRSRTIAIAPSAPGRYEARARDLPPGEHTLRATLQGEGGAPLQASGHVLVPSSIEARPPFGADEALLAAAAAYTGGGALPAPEQLLETPVRGAGGRRERWQPLVWIALVLLVLDVAARRLPPLGRSSGGKQRQAT